MSAVSEARDIASSTATPPRPGAGATRERFALLTEHTHRDISVGRLLEAHWDADAILRDLGRDPVGDDQLWGVWAAESSTAVLTAARDTTGAWTVSGTKPWCSGATGCTHALVTARTGDGRAMFIVQMGQASVTAAGGDWHNAGMAATQTHAVEFSETPVEFVADADAYLQRPGFWHGAVGVAACWFGGASLVADRLFRQRKSDDLTLVHIGAVDTALWSGAAALTAAADAFDAAPDDLEGAHAIALRVRAIIEQVATEVIDRVGRCLGPGPLVADEAHAQAVADLMVYLRQSHAEQDLRALGALVHARDEGGVGAP
ncbi:acyl-CoA dehydrogenase family protein [Williamsia sp.]|uniref:acyl-CoA dehydrogenase family protein n=1 Tax=Williamsia sp. TaxID=1872085 RepID=UPI001A23126B|nr:acyl-CoA dehydrogenase family protein [Williamsia sp.]MBJ7291000.1 acyl-CoA dehydrogenase family protein [Williamsia sp.]